MRFSTLFTYGFIQSAVDEIRVSKLKVDKSYISATKSLRQNFEFRAHVWINSHQKIRISQVWKSCENGFEALKPSRKCFKTPNFAYELDFDSFNRQSQDCDIFVSILIKISKIDRFEPHTYWINLKGWQELFRWNFDTDYLNIGLKLLCFRKLILFLNFELHQFKIVRNFLTRNFASKM